MGYDNDAFGAAAFIVFISMAGGVLLAVLAYFITAFILGGP